MDYRIIRRVAILLITTSLSACGALSARQDEDRWGIPYAGTKLYVNNRCWHATIRAYAPISIIVPLVIIDFPLTLITDTILLPVDLSITPGVPKNQECYETPAPITFSQYLPEATWGMRSEPGGCLPPRITIAQPKFPRLAIEFGLENEVRAKALDLRDPSIFIHFDRSMRSLADLYADPFTNRQGTLVRVKSSTSVLSLELADGTSHHIEVPELADEMILAGSKVIRLTLKGVKPQSLVVTFPIFTVDGTELGGGTIKFNYGETTAVCGLKTPST